MSTRTLIVLVSCLSLMVASCGSSSDNSFSANGNSGNGNAGQANNATGTAPVTFQFTLAQQTDIVPPSIGTIRFVAKNENGDDVLDETRQKDSSITVDIPVTATSCCLIYLSNSTPIFQGLVPLTLRPSQSLSVIAPLGDPVPAPVLDPITLSPNNSTVAINSTTSFVATSANGFDITSQGSFISSDSSVFRFDSASSGTSLSLGSSLITFNAPKRAPGLVIGAAGGTPEVKVRDPRAPEGGNIQNFFPFNPGFTGGVRVATGDVNGDGVNDVITAPGPGAGPHVRIFDGQSGESLSSFFAYDSNFVGGVFVAAGDVNNDGRADVITGADAGGGPHVKVFSGQDNSELHNFFAYDNSFFGGVRVGAADVNGDGFDDVITGAGPGGGPHVKVFDGRDSNNELGNFFAYDPGFSGGVFVAGGDVNNDGREDIITGPGAGGGPHVKVFDGQSNGELGDFFAYDNAFNGGVRVAAVDSTGDGSADIITGPGPGAPPQVRIFDGSDIISVNSTSPTAVSSFFAYTPSFTGGLFVSSSSVVSSICTSSTLISVSSSSGGGAPATPSDSSLSILTFPSSAIQLQPFTPFITVRVNDANGNPITNSTSVSIGISPLSSVPAGAQIRGTTTVQTVNGVASFIGIDVTHPGTYQFVISTSSSSITSSSLIVTESSIVTSPGKMFVSIPARFDAFRYSPLTGLGPTTMPQLQFPLAGAIEHRHCAFDQGRDILYTVARQINDLCVCITSNASGTNPQTRIVRLDDQAGNNVTSTTNQGCIYLDSPNDTIYVGNGGATVFAYSSASTLMTSSTASRFLQGTLNVVGLDGDPANNRLFFATNTGNTSLFLNFRTANGPLTTLGFNAAGITNSSDVKYDPGNQRLYVSDQGGNNLICYDVDPATHNLTPGANFNVAGNANAVDAHKGLLYVSNSSDGSLVIFNQNNPPNPLSSVTLGNNGGGVCVGD